VDDTGLKNSGVVLSEKSAIERYDKFVFELILVFEGVW